MTPAECPICHETVQLLATAVVLLDPKDFDDPYWAPAVDICVRCAGRLQTEAVTYAR